MKKRMNIGLIGHKFMGKAHSHAYRDVAMFFDSGVVPVMKVLCGVGDDLASTAERYGWARFEESWEKVVSDPDIDIIDICTPDNYHKEIAIAAAKHGKHVLCEKPLALTLQEAREMQAAVERAGVVNMVNFTYRGVPAIRLAKNLIDEGRLGSLYHFNAFYQQDFSLSEDFPFVWRMDKEAAGAGTMADKGAHVIDLARYLAGEFHEVACRAATFIKERTDPGTGAKRSVTTNDAAVFLSTFQSGAIGLFEVSNMSAGRKNALVLEISGSRGALRFDLERMNELSVYFADDPEEVQGFRTLLVTQPSHPYISHWWPTGHVLGWENTFVHQIHEFLLAISEGRKASPDFFEGVKCQEVVDAIARADAERRWIAVAKG
jgi:predicted dehydrogenase